MVRIGVASVLCLFLGVLSGIAVGQSIQGFYVGDGDGAWLGVSVTDVSKKIMEERHLSSRDGALVNEVVEDSPAEDAGLREGDLILRFDDRVVEDSDDLVRAVRKSEGGDRVKIVINREGESKTLTATLKQQRKRNSFAYRVPSVPRVAPAPRGPFRLDFMGHESPAGLKMQELGTQLGEFFEVPGNRGVLVISVNKNSAGEKAGVKAGDVIVRVNGNSVRDVEDCLDEIHDADADEVSLDLIRRGKPVKVTVTIEPSDRMSGNLFFDDGHARIRDGLRYLKENFHEYRHEGWPGDREELEELKENLRDMKEELKEGVRENLRESLFDLRDLRDGLREAIHEHLPLLRRAARTAFFSI